MNNNCKASLATIRFNKLFRVTESICDIDNSINYNSVVQKKHDRWKVLVDIWHINQKKLCKNVCSIYPERSNILSAALARIFAGIYPYYIDEEVIPLVDMIEETFLNDKEAVFVWTQTNMFQDALKDTYEEICIGITFSYFQFAQGLLRIFEGKELTEHAKRYINSIFEKSSMNINDIDILKSIYEKGKTMINTLFPKSQSWTSTQMCTNDTICDACKEVYGFECDYLSVYDLPAFHFIEHIQNGTEIPLSVVRRPCNAYMAYTLLGNKADDILYNIFCEAMEAWHDDLGYVRFSWIFDTVEKWVYNNNHPYCKAVKKHVYELSILFNKADEERYK